MKKLFNLCLFIVVLLSVNSFAQQHQSLEDYKQEEKVQKIMANFNKYTYLYRYSSQKLSIEEVVLELEKFKNSEHAPIVNALKKIVDKHSGASVKVKNHQLDSVINVLTTFVDEHPETDVEMCAYPSPKGVILSVRLSFRAYGDDPKDPAPKGMSTYLRMVNRKVELLISDSIKVDPDQRFSERELVDKYDNAYIFNKKDRLSRAIIYKINCHLYQYDIRALDRVADEVYGNNDGIVTNYEFFYVQQNFSEVVQNQKVKDIFFHKDEKE